MMINVQINSEFKHFIRLPWKINKTVVDSFDGTSISTMSKVGLAPVSISKRRQTTQVIIYPNIIGKWSDFKIRI